MRRTAVAVIGFGCAIGVFAGAGTIPVGATAADRNQASSNVTGAGAPANGAVAKGGLGTALPASSDARRVASVPATLSRLDQYSEQHEFQAAASDSDLSVTGTYGGDTGRIESIIRGLHKRAAQPSGTSAGKARKAVTGAGILALTLPIKADGYPEPAVTLTSTITPKPQLRQNRPAHPSRWGHRNRRGHRKRRGHRNRRAHPSRRAHRSPRRRRRPSSSTLVLRIPSPSVNGFDTCTAPSVNAMKAWKRRYSAIGVYIGGQNMACDYGNLSASWVKSVHLMGWSLLPLYVGLQAPCNRFPAKINRRSAASQGKSAADTAVGDAANFGMRRGTPIYFDMESYNNSNGRCRSAVLAFLDAWTRELHARRYASGVYTSASSGVSALVGTRTINGHALARPDALWFALWANNGNLIGTPRLPARRWAADWVQQYASNKRQKIGGYTLTIDADRVGGAVSGP